MFLEADQPKKGRTDDEFENKYRKRDIDASGLR